MEKTCRSDGVEEPEKDEEFVECPRCKHDAWLIEDGTQALCLNCGLRQYFDSHMTEEVPLNDPALLKILTSESDEGLYVDTAPLFKLHVQRTMLPEDLPPRLKVEIAEAVGFCVNQGYCEFEELANVAKGMGWLCSWDGRLHASLICDRQSREFEESKEKALLTGSCGCSRGAMACLYTGIQFDHGGVLKVGDLFGCKEHRSLTIFGIPEGSRGIGQAVAMFEGTLEPAGNFLKAKAGKITLFPDAFKRVHPEWIEASGKRW